jgi:hypothetical protein
MKWKYCRPIAALDQLPFQHKDPTCEWVDMSWKVSCDANSWACIVQETTAWQLVVWNMTMESSQAGSIQVLYHHTSWPTPHQDKHITDAAFLLE